MAIGIQGNVFCSASTSSILYMTFLEYRDPVVHLVVSLRKIYTASSKLDFHVYQKTKELMINRRSQIYLLNLEAKIHFDFDYSA